MKINARKKKHGEQKKTAKKQNGTEIPSDGPPLPRAPGKKIRRSGEPLTPIYIIYAHWRIPKQALSVRRPQK